MEIIKTRMLAETVAKDSNDFTRWIDKGSSPAFPSRFVQSFDKFRCVRVRTR